MSRQLLQTIVAGARRCHLVRHYAAAATAMRTALPQQTAPAAGRFLKPRTLSHAFSSVPDTVAPEADKVLVEALAKEIEEEDKQSKERVDLEAQVPSGYSLTTSSVECQMVLEKKYENEQIKIIYSANQDTQGLDDEDYEDEKEEDEEEEEEDDDFMDMEGLDFTVEITKGDSRKLVLDIVTTSKTMRVRKVKFEDSATESMEDSYQGPFFEDLDESVKYAFEDYLAVRGIDLTMADYIKESIMEKEENEYRKWLGNVHEFFAK